MKRRIPRAAAGRCTAGLATAALIAGLAGCGGEQPQNAGEGQTAGTTGATSTTGATAPQTGAKGTLTGAGATFPYPIYSKWFDAYNNKTGIAINYQSIGSGGGIQQLKAGTVDFGASDAPLKPDDEKSMPGAVVHVPTVGGAVAVAYNLPGVTKLQLDGTTLADIYLGKITKWNDPAIAKLNAGAKLPDTAIAVAHRSDGSGTTSIFTNYLKAVSADWSSKVGAGKSVSWPVGLGGKGNEGVAGIVTKSPGAVGYIELAYAMQAKIAMASLKNKDGKFVDPSVDSTTAAIAGAIPALQKDIKTPTVNEPGATAYPIAGLTYILAYKQQKDKAKGKLLTDFLQWAMKDGQGMAKDLQYAPLPPEVIKINAATIASIQ